MVVIIQREKVPNDSFNIHSVGYDSNQKVLEIQFWRGRGEEKVPGDVYRYFDVPEQEHQNLIAAASHGKYFSAHIKNEYRYEKVT